MSEPDFDVEWLLRNAELRIEGRPLTSEELDQMDREAQEFAFAESFAREQEDDE